MVRAGEKALHHFLTQARVRSKKEANESHWVYRACQNIAAIYKMSRSSGAVDDEFFVDFQDEIARELRLMEAEEA